MTKNGWMWTVLVFVVLVVLFVVLGKNSGDLAKDTSSVINNDNSIVLDGPVVSSSDTTLARDKFGNIIVRYTEEGFVPKLLTLKMGEGVLFRNDSSSALQIAPADTVNEPYATFDQSKTSLGVGGTYSYNFTTSGSYTYFNLNKKTDIARITV